MNNNNLRPFGQSITANRAYEPSNYIWENMHYTKLRRTKQLIYVLIGVAIALFIGYYIQFRLQSTLSRTEKYEKMDCNQFH